MVKTFVGKPKGRKNNLSSEVRNIISSLAEAERPSMRKHVHLEEVPQWVEDREGECFMHTKTVIQTGIENRAALAISSLSGTPPSALPQVCNFLLMCNSCTSVCIITNIISLSALLLALIVFVL